MRIITTKKQVDLRDIQQAIGANWKDMTRKLKLKAYYDGKHKILQKNGRKHDAPNNKLVANFPAYVSNIATNFFIGRPISYQTTTEHEPELKALLDIFQYNDEAAHNLALAEEASITGVAYEILYIDGDSKVRFASVPSEEMILICDATLEENIICAIRDYKVYSFDYSTYDEFVDVYEEQKVSHYAFTGGSLKFLESNPHYFGDVPIVEYANNRHRKGDFEDILSLVDAYNKAQSLTMDDMEDFTDAFLVLKGMGGTNGDDIKELRKEKAIILDEGGGAEWLIKNINDSYIENVKTRLERDIHKFAQIPDLSDENFAGNASGVAIRYKLIGLEQVRGRKEREFKRGLQRRIELIDGILTLKNQVKVDFRDIDVQFTANIPSNITEQAQIVNQLDGLVSQKTLLGLLPFIDDPMKELAEMEKSKEFDELTKL